MAIVERIIRVEFHDDYELVSRFLRWLIDTKPEVQQLRGGMTGRGSYQGHFPIEEEARLHEFFLGVTEKEPDDDF